MKTKIAEAVVRELFQEGTRLAILQSTREGGEHDLGGWNRDAALRVVGKVLKNHDGSDTCDLCDDGVLQVMRAGHVKRQWCFCAKGLKAKAADDAARSEMLGT